MHKYRCAQSKCQEISHSIGGWEIKQGISKVSSFVESVVWKEYARDVVDFAKTVERFVCRDGEVGQIPGLEKSSD